MGPIWGQFFCQLHSWKLYVKKSAQDSTPNPTGQNLKKPPSRQDFFGLFFLYTWLAQSPWLGVGQPVPSLQSISTGWGGKGLGRIHNCNPPANFPAVYYYYLYHCTVFRTPRILTPGVGGCHPARDGVGVDPLGTPTPPPGGFPAQPWRCCSGWRRGRSATCSRSWWTAAPTSTPRRGGTSGTCASAAPGSAPRPLPPGPSGRPSRCGVVSGCRGAIAVSSFARFGLNV